jgi:hypothetical protein
LSDESLANGPVRSVKTDSQELETGLPERKRQLLL